jgi:hypothetical protein
LTDNCNTIQDEGCDYRDSQYLQAPALLSPPE